MLDLFGPVHVAVLALVLTLALVVVCRGPEARRLARERRDERDRRAVERDRLARLHRSHQRLVDAGWQVRAGRLEPPPLPGGQRRSPGPAVPLTPRAAPPAPGRAPARRSY